MLWIGGICAAVFSVTGYYALGAFGALVGLVLGVIVAGWIVEALDLR